MGTIFKDISKRASTLLSTPEAKKLTKALEEKLGTASEEAKTAEPTGPGRIPLGATALFSGLLFLFGLALWRTVTQRGTGNCGNGWALMTLMPLLIAAATSIYVGWDNSRRGLMYAPDPYRLMIAFTAILAVLQYVLSIALIRINRPGVSLLTAARRSLITVIWTLIPAIMGMVSYYMITTWLPRAIPAAGQAVKRTIDAIPLLNRIYKSQAHWLSAWGFGVGNLIVWVPIVGLMLAPILNFLPMTPLLSLAGYGVACRGA